MKLEKAYLKALDNDVPDIHFMFNPTKLSFVHEAISEENQGAQTGEKGNTKTNFSHIKNRVITISDIVFDTYEERTDVQVYLRPFICAVEFVSHVKQFASQIEEDLSKLVGDRAAQFAMGAIDTSVKLTANDEDTKYQRTPIYRFIWGNQDKYLPYCLVQQLSYDLTKFLPDGTPVRAVIGQLTLKETDGRAKPLLNKLKPDRLGDSVTARLGGMLGI